MRKNFYWIIPLVVILGFLAWWLLSPLFFDKTVDDKFPVGITNGGTMDLADFDRLIGLPTGKELASIDPDLLKTVEKEMLDKAASMPDVMVEEGMAGSGSLMEDGAVLSGAFFGLDAVHQGSGEVEVFKLDDGSHLLRLENLEVTNGPDLFLYLTNVGGAKSSAEVKSGFYDLGRLKGNKGNQNYVIPADVDIDGYKGVAIYCRAFGVLFAAAELKG